MSVVYGSICWWLRRLKSEQRLIGPIGTKSSAPWKRASFDHMFSDVPTLRRCVSVFEETAVSSEEGSGGCFRPDERFDDLS